MRVPITRPWFDDEDRAFLSAPLDDGWVVQGPRVAEFERRFAAFAGAEQAVAVSSCTTGLHLAMAELEIGPGDEVLVPAFTWVATANVALYQGATPVLCDVSLDTFNVDVADLAARITPRTKALLPVHLFGRPADMGPLLALARERGLAVVEDAACGFGARFQGQHVGTLGQHGVFSFHPRKALTTGEGGMCLTDDPLRALRLRSLRDHGASVGDLARHQAKGGFLLGGFELLGYNYRMTDIQGALGVTQMAKATRICERRAALAARFHERLAPLDWLALPTVNAGDTHGWQAYVCLFRPEAPTLANLARLTAWRNRLMEKLETLGVSTRQGTHAVHNLGLYQTRFGYRPEDFPQAWMAESLSLTLPLFPTMTEEEQDYVVTQLAVAMDAVCAG